MLVLDDDDAAAKIRALMNQGRGSMGQWLSHIYLGYNFRMSEVQAAIGIEQVKRLDEILKLTNFKTITTNIIQITVLNAKQ